MNKIRFWIVILSVFVSVKTLSSSQYQNWHQEYVNGLLTNPTYCQGMIPFDVSIMRRYAMETAPVVGHLVPSNCTFETFHWYMVCLTSCAHDHASRMGSGLQSILETHFQWLTYFFQQPQYEQIARGENIRHLPYLLNQIVYLTHAYGANSFHDILSVLKSILPVQRAHVLQAHYRELTTNESIAERLQRFAHPMTIYRRAPRQITPEVVEAIIISPEVLHAQQMEIIDDEAVQRASFLAKEDDIFSAEFKDLQQRISDIREREAATERQRIKLEKAKIKRERKAEKAEKQRIAKEKECQKENILIAVRKIKAGQRYKQELLQTKFNLWGDFVTHKKQERQKKLDQRLSTLCSVDTLEPWKDILSHPQKNEDIIERLLERKKNRKIIRTQQDLMEEMVTLIWMIITKNPSLKPLDASTLFSPICQKVTLATDAQKRCISIIHSYITVETQFSGLDASAVQAVLKDLSGIDTPPASEWVRQLLAPFVFPRFPHIKETRLLEHPLYPCVIAETLRLSLNQIPVLIKEPGHRPTQYEAVLSTMSAYGDDFRIPPQYHAPVIKCIESLQAEFQI